MRAATGIRRHSRVAGFTLLELMVVMLVLGLLASLVVGNMGRWIPSASLDSQANQLRSWLDYLRSEAKIQGKPYSLELDIENHRTRIHLPPEDKLVSVPDDTAAANLIMGWQPLEDWVKFEGHGVWGREIYTKGQVMITFDENGFTADQSIYLKYDEPDNKLLWSIHLNGLNGTTSVVRNREGNRDVQQAQTEAAFR